RLRASAKAIGFERNAGPARADERTGSFLSDKPPGLGIGSTSLTPKAEGKVCVGVYRFAAREHLLGLEFPSAGLDAGGSEQNHSNQKRCKEFGPISSLERRLVPPIRALGSTSFWSVQKCVEQFSQSYFSC